jgi:hypothetical protein
MATQPTRPPQTPPHVPPRPTPPQPPPPKPDPKHEAAAHRPGAPFEQPQAGRPARDPQEAKLELDRARAAGPIPQSDRTIADEQRERSDEIAAMGVEKYKQSIDMRSPEDRPKAVAGVGELEKHEGVAPKPVERHDDARR